MLAFLWFVGHEATSYRDVCDRFNLCLDTMFNIITRICNFLLSIAPSEIRFPTAEEKKRTAQYFQQQYGFPGVIGKRMPACIRYIKPSLHMSCVFIGAIDGTHIRLDRPQQDPDSYINRNKYYSIHLQGIADERKKFIDVFVGFPGGVHDARVFRESDVFNEMNPLCSGNSFL